MDTGELEALGLYDPADEHAALRLELLEYLIALGASTDDLLFFRDRLPGLAATLGIRGGRGKTLAQVAGSSGLGVGRNPPAGPGGGVPRSRSRHGVVHGGLRRPGVGGRGRERGVR